MWLPLPRPNLGFMLPATGKLSGFGAVSAKNLTFTFDPSLMLAGFGAIIGFRAGISLLLGGFVSWGLLGPWGLSQSFILPGDDHPTASWFPSMIEWLLWPGVSLMVASALTSFLLRTLDDRRQAPYRDNSVGRNGGTLARLIGLSVSSALVVIAQIAIFGIHWTIAALAVPAAFLLAMVASRVVGETGIPPIGAIGKVSQLGTGLTAPGEMTANLIGANVAGGAEGQSADLLNDFKRWQPSLAQRFLIAAASGLIAGESLAGVAHALLGILG